MKKGITLVFIGGTVVWLVFAVLERFPIARDVHQAINSKFGQTLKQVKMFSITILIVLNVLVRRFGLVDIRLLLELISVQFYQFITCTSTAVRKIWRPSKK